VRLPFFAPRFHAFAHRGGSDYTPNVGRENTIHAFRSAVSLGYRYCETDVHVTRDRRLVCFHDETLDRVTNGHGQIHDHALAELADVTTLAGDHIPTFDEVMETLPDTRFNIDLKAPGAVAPLAEGIRRHHAENRVCVASFSQRRLSEFRHLTRGKIMTGIAAPGVAWTAFMPGLPALIASPGAVLQAPAHQTIRGVTIPVVTRLAVWNCHQAGKYIHAWTIDDPDEMNRLIDLGVDGIITDRPDVLKDVLITRDLWED